LLHFSTGHKGSIQLHTKTTHTADLGNNPLDYKHELWLSLKF